MHLTFSKLKTPLTLAALLLTLGGCGGGDDGEGSGMGGASNGAGRIACETDSQCDDGLFCNGEESCEAGFCEAGERVDCDDGIECTVDFCDERTRACTNEGPDEDGDGFAAADCEDADGSPLGTDCDDEDPLRFPGNVEICDPDFRDEDCDPSTIGTQDSDNDGFVSDTCCNEQEDGELLCGEDCDDFKTNVNPLGTEACDFLDNNCDGEVDEGVSVEMYPDLDHDGHGETGADPIETCPGAVGVADDTIDCDDTDPEVFTGQFEICDGKDNNCNDAIDEIQQAAPWYMDQDGDTYGDANSTPIFSCYRVPGRVLSRNDCNDSLNTVNPNATEICDGRDNDCNGLADFRLAGVNNFEDDDGDGIADADCGGDDCNDRDARTGLGKDEVCDRIDNDCDGLVDEQTTQNIWYIDEDGDGWGVVLGSALASCDPLVGRASNYGDCDDDRNDVRPGVVDLCDGIDNNCNGLIDEGASAYCNIQNANPICRAGQCRIFSCQAGFADDPAQPGPDCLLAFTPTPNGDLCTVNADCDDGSLCNGFEYCSGGDCYDGTPVNCQALEGVFEGDVTISSGTDLQALEGVDWITGDLIIGDDPMETSPPFVTLLIGLENLRIVGGSVIIRDTDLTALSGSALSNLESVGGDIIIENNGNLMNVDLPSLLSARSLQIRGNNNLRSISGFANLAILDHSLVIENHEVLESISGFTALSRVGDPSGEFVSYFSTEDSPCSDDGIVIRGNFGLSGLPTFDALSTVAGDLCVHDTIGGALSLPVLAEVLRSININSATLSAVDLPQLTALLDFVYSGPYMMEEGPGGAVSIALPELTEAEYLSINSIPDLDSLSMPKLEFVGNAYLFLDSLSNLSELDFSALVEVENDLNVTLSGSTSAATVSFPALVYPGDFADFSISLEGMTGLEFPVMTGRVGSGPGQSTTSSLAIWSVSTTLETLSLPAFRHVGVSLNIDVYADELDMNRMTSVGESLHICTGGVDFDANLQGDPTLLCDAAAPELSDLAPVGFENTTTCEACL